MYDLPWQELGEAESREFEAELIRETPAGHLLYGKTVRAIAKRCDRDDVLFEVAGGPHVAVVHLTYSIEADPAWPDTTVYASLQEFYAQRMNLDFADYSR